VELLALTGQRREEVARLQRDELDLVQGVWTIPKSRTKNGKAHVVHLSKQSMAVLKRAHQSGPYVFSLVGTKPFQEFSRAKPRLDQLSGVTRWRLHDLRRTCVSGMVGPARTRLDAVAEPMRYHALIALCVTTSRSEMCSGEAGSRKQVAEENRGNPTPHSYDHRFQAFVGGDVEVHPERGNVSVNRFRLIVADSGESIAVPSEFPGILWVGS